ENVLRVGEEVSVPFLQENIGNKEVIPTRGRLSGKYQNIVRSLDYVSAIVAYLLQVLASDVAMIITTSLAVLALFAVHSKLS
ncbi:hypothetical protein MKW98_003325, partial [Papaver atlanticum]